MMICFILNIMSAFTVVVRVLRCVMDNETTPKTKKVGNENEKNTYVDTKKLFFFSSD